MLSATTSYANCTAALDGTTDRELRILLVEDSVRLQSRLTELLTLSGVMKVTGVADTEDGALELIAAQTFDVLVVDVELRQGSGINVIRKTRARSELTPAPLIIVLTNYGLRSVRERALAAGADHFLDKMHEFDQLLPLISAARH
jgi:two-component system, OmpR family, response regulator